MLVKMDLAKDNLEKVEKFPLNVMCWFSKKWDDTHIYTEICNENYDVLQGSVVIDTDGNIVEKSIMEINENSVDIETLKNVEGFKYENNFRGLIDLLNV